jgi:N-acetylglucosamine-6-phosphate deacetylase
VTVYRAARVVGGDVPPDAPAWVEVDAGRVVATGVGSRGATADGHDLGDVVLAPAFVDVQVNGFGAVDFATASPPECAALLDELRAGGLAACCPTICTAPLDAYAPILERWAGLADHPAFAGLHLEGPFLGGAPGAHPPHLVRPVDLDWLRDLLERFGALLRVVTLAPEADPGAEATRLLVAHGVTVALGHTRATYDDVRAFAAAGARVVTHVFNGMGPLHHREPGTAGAALTDERLTPSLIADLVHVHPAVVQLAVKARPDLVLVSDAVALAPGVEQHGDGAAYLPDGTLAGSTLTMAKAVENVASLGVPTALAVAMASANPARVIDRPDLGCVVPGARADLVLLERATSRFVTRL